MPSSYLIFCRPLFLLPPTLPSVRVFSNESTLHTSWPKPWSVRFSISPSNEHPGWTGWISLHSKGLSRVQHQFSSAQLSSQSNSNIHSMTTGKTIALTRWTFDGKVMSLLFNMLSRLIITFLLRSKHLLISWLQ